MANLAVNPIVDAGTKPVFVAAAVSDTAAVGTGSNSFVVYKNASAANVKTITITVPGVTDYGAALPDPAITLPVLSEVWIPLRREYRAIDGGGLATLTISGTGLATDVTVALVRI
jgi:hypothetical protein